MAANTTLSALARSHALLRYTAALLVLVAAVALGRTLAPVLGDSGGFVAYAVAFLALAFSAWYCGVGPSILVAVLALAALRLSFVHPLHPFPMPTPGSILGMLILVAISAAIIWLGEGRRRENEALHRAQGELEDHVKERTLELDAANHGLRELTARLMQLQDEERRRIARELHDSIGQNLAALTMNLTKVGAEIERLSQSARTVNDSLTLAEEMHKEIRTVSYLLHPPLLDELGLASALRWYVEGFAERSKIQVDLDIPDDFGRLPQEMETALFRTVQECLTNIHRHSGSPVAAIHLARAAHEIHLKIEDRGAGISPEKLDEVSSGGTPGVGIRGMRERMRQLGGSLAIQSAERGTIVEARLPVTQSSELPASGIAA
ncbi:MAG TPA: histidine kinase [Candidatus Sulfotelmatobacter sp.]|nr:histidine kinase [Candidatus Sulfotelmatobacter sp.]